MHAVGQALWNKLDPLKYLHRHSGYAEGPGRTRELATGGFGGTPESVAPSGRKSWVSCRKKAPRLLAPWLWDFLGVD